MTIEETIRKISFFNNLNDGQIELITSISNVSKNNCIKKVCFFCEFFKK